MTATHFVIDEEWVQEGTEAHDRIARFAGRDDPTTRGGLHA